MKNKELKACRYLLFTSYANIALLFAFNLYIAYNIILYFTDDGFSFIGGIMLAMIYFISIPVQIFDFNQLDAITNPRKALHFLHFVLAFVYILVGLILTLINPLGGLVLIIEIFNLIFIILCKKSKKKLLLLP